MASITRIPTDANEVLSALVTQLRSPAAKGTAAAQVATLLESTDFSPISPELADVIGGDTTCMSVMAEVFSNQERASTLRQFAPMWKRWADFACEHELEMFPPICEDRRRFDAGFTKFACYEYDLARKGGRNKKRKKKANKPGSFNQIFQGIDHIMTKIFHKEAMNVEMVNCFKTSYRLKYSSPVKKARPLLGKHLRTLVKVAKRLNQDWFTFVVDVVIIAWMSAGRWSCINNIDMEKSTGGMCDIMGENPDPNGKYWLLFWNERKNVDGESCTEIPILADKDFDPRTRFMNMVNRYNLGSKLCPDFKKVQGKSVWNVIDNPGRSCSYQKFLEMFRAAMKIAQLTNVCDITQRPGQVSSMEWSLHAFRRGFVTEMRGKGGNSIFIETIARHGGWSYEWVETILGYNSVTTTDHVKMILPAILTALDDKSGEGTIVSAQADHSGSRHGTNYENLIGRHFVDSEDEDSDYTVASITGNDVTSTGGVHESWDLDYVLGKLSTHKRRRVR